MPTRSDESLRERSAVYQALAIALGPPEDAGPVAGARGWRRLCAALEEIGVETRAPRRGAQASLGERCAEIFGHTARGRISPYETEYGREASLFLASHELADIGAFIAAFGLVLDERARERVDHIRVECELMAFLVLKEVYAREVGDAEMLETARHAQRLFLRDQLGRFAPALGEKLRREDADGFYGALGGTLRSFVESECVRLGVPAGPEDLAMRLIVDDGAPSACGTCESAASCT
jgi:TorA maturation chaperone TorD